MIKFLLLICIAAVYADDSEDTENFETLLSKLGNEEDLASVFTNAMEKPVGLSGKDISHFLEMSQEQDLEDAAKTFAVLNKIDVPIYFHADCSKAWLTSSSMKVSGKLSGGKSGATGGAQSTAVGSTAAPASGKGNKNNLGVEGSYEQKKTWAHTHAAMTKGYSKVYPGRRSTNYQDCAKDTIYVWLKWQKKDGSWEQFTDGKAEKHGRSLVITGSSNAPKMKYGGYECNSPYRDCGCWKGWCTKFCGNHNWCYTGQGEQYTRCKSNTDCGRDWECGGKCGGAGRRRGSRRRFRRTLLETIEDLNSEGPE